MKAIFICILTLSSFITLNAQEDEKIFEKVGVEASTDLRKFGDHVKRKIQLPDSVLKNIPPGTYTVNVQFIIDKHGSIGQVVSKNDPGFGLAKRAVNIISTYTGTWQPANQCGRAVKAYKIQPITFIVAPQ